MTQTVQTQLSGQPIKSVIVFMAAEVWNTYTPSKVLMWGSLMDWQWWRSKESISFTSTYRETNTQNESRTGQEEKTPNIVYKVIFDLLQIQTISHCLKFVQVVNNEGESSKNKMEVNISLYMYTVHKNMDQKIKGFWLSFKQLELKYNTSHYKLSDYWPQSSSEELRAWPLDPLYPVVRCSVYCSCCRTSSYQS